MSEIKMILRNLLLSILVIGIFFIGLEFLYRGYRIYKYNKLIREEIYEGQLTLIKPLGDKLEYVLKPNAEFSTQAGIMYKTNSKGLRDREFNYQKTKNTYRILALGDSYTFGWDEPLEYSYPKQLEKILNSEVINAGVFGYNTEIEYEYLKKEGIKYNPDLVVVGFVVNDAEPQTGILISPYWEMENANSWLLELIKDRLNVFFKKDIFTLKRIGYSCHSWENFGWRKGRCFKAVKNIKKFLDKNEIPLLVVIFPSLEYQSGKIAPYDKYVQYKIINDSLGDFCKKENINILDLYPFFEDKEVKDVRQESGHLNREGYSIVAEAIAEYIKKHYI